MTKKKVNKENLHPIFHSCVWRYPPKIFMTIDEQLQACAECYANLKETTPFCEHIKRYWKGEAPRKLSK